MNGNKLRKTKNLAGNYWYNIRARGFHIFFDKISMSEKWSADARQIRTTQFLFFNIFYFLKQYKYLDTRYVNSDYLPTFLIQSQRFCNVMKSKLQIMAQRKKHLTSRPWSIDILRCLILFRMVYIKSIKIIINGVNCILRYIFWK